MNKSELEQRFLSLVDSYKQVIYKVCFMYATDDETISDLYQEVVLNLWTAFPRFRNESKPSTWVYRISMNTCISRAPVMLGQASAIKVRNQVSEYPPLSKLAGCPFYVPRYGLQRYEIFQPYRSKKFVMRLAFRMAEGYYYKKT